MCPTQILLHFSTKHMNFPPCNERFIPEQFCCIVSGVETIDLFFNHPNSISSECHSCTRVVWHFTCKSPTKAMSEFVTNEGSLKNNLRRRKDHSLIGLGHSIGWISFWRVHFHLIKFIGFRCTACESVQGCISVSECALLFKFTATANYEMRKNRWENGVDSQVMRLTQSCFDS